MAQYAPIILADGKATPVNHTFSPTIIDAAGIARYEDRISGIPIGFNRLSLQLKRPENGDGSYRVIAKMYLPILEQTSPSTASGIQPAPVIGYTLGMTVETFAPSRSLIDYRKDLHALGMSLIGSQVFKSMVIDTDNPW